MKALKQSCFVIGFTLASSAVIAGPNDVATIDVVPSGPQDTSILNQNIEAPDMKGDTRYSGEEIGKAYLDARDELIEARNAVKTMVFRKANPILGSLENFDVGVASDMTDVMIDIRTMLKIDTSLFTEKDPVAVPMIPIADTGFSLPTDMKIPVSGNSNIQVYPLKANGEVVGHVRLACGGYLKEDVLINQDSVSYCVTSLLATGVSRNSGVHKANTTNVTYLGISEPYMVGHVNEVSVNWMTHPKMSAEGTLRFYNLHNVPNAVKTLNYETNITISDGTVFAGRNARISQ